MNNFGFDERDVAKKIPAFLMDDFLGNVPNRPTLCDVYGVVDAAYRQ